MFCTTTPAESVVVSWINLGASSSKKIIKRLDERISSTAAAAAVIGLEVVAAAAAAAFASADWCEHVTFCDMPFPPDTPGGWGVGWPQNTLHIVMCNMCCRPQFQALMKQQPQDHKELKAM